MCLNKAYLLDKSLVHMDKLLMMNWDTWNVTFLLKYAELPQNFFVQLNTANKFHLNDSQSLNKLKLVFVWNINNNIFWY